MRATLILLWFCVINLQVMYTGIGMSEIIDSIGYNLLCIERKIMKSFRALATSVANKGS